MKTFRRIANWIRDSKGLATSSLEAAATIAVGAVLAGVGVSGGIDAINNAKIQAAIADVSTIGQAVFNFYRDNAFFPLFVDGQRTGAGDTFYGFLVSENGTYPTDSTTGGYLGSGNSWNIPASENTWQTVGYFGHMPDYSVGAAGHATIEGHLIRNTLGQPPSSAAYPTRGNYTGDPERGWNGPYITSLPKTDPWGDKYIINVRNLHAGYLKNLSNPNTYGAAPGTLPGLGVVVLSAGPNRNIETFVDQPASSVTVGGDDIVFRIK
jgi:hypothetical protein